MSLFLTSLEAVSLLSDVSTTPDWVARDKSLPAPATTPNKERTMVGSKAKANFMVCEGRRCQKL
jgi:hypothetical protein